MNLKEYIEIKVDGVITSKNSIPIEVLNKIANSLQALINDVAKVDLIDEQSIKLENFKIELCGFRAGSAIPAFKFTEVTQTMLGADIEKQKEKVNNSVAKILSIADDGDFAKLKELYPAPEIRNTIIRDIYDFTNSAGNAKMYVVKDATPEYEIKKLKKSVMEALTTKIEGEKTKADEPQTKLAKIRDGKKRTIIHVFDEKISSGDFAPEVINHNGVQYNLKYPLRSKIDFVDNMVIIENEMLGIYAYGATEDEAEEMFNAEFHYVFVRYNELPDENLDKEVLFVKQFVNQIVVSHG